MKKNIIVALSLSLILLMGIGCGNGTENKQDKSMTDEADLSEILLNGVFSLENEPNNKIDRSITGENSSEMSNILDALSKYNKNYTVVKIVKPMKSKTLKSGFTDMGNSNNKIYAVIYSEKPNSYTKKYKGFFYLKKYRSKFSGKSYDGIILIFEMTYKNGYFDKVDHREILKKSDLNLNTVLSKTSLITPKNGEKEVSQYNTKFEWRSVSDATEYRFLLSTKKDFSNFSDSYSYSNNKNECISDGCYTYPNKDDKGPLTLNSFLVEKLKNSGQTYYWKVRAYNANTKAASPWSTTGVFKTKGSSGDSNCKQGQKGGQCVVYVRKYFGGSYNKMPGLCQYYPYDCGAYHAYSNWSLGYGKGKYPKDKSMMVISKQNGLKYGHIAVVYKATNNYNGTWTLIVSESNWDLDERIDCNVVYTYSESKNAVRRKNSANWLALKGFIYSK